MPELLGADEPPPSAGLLGVRFNCISMTPSMRSLTVSGFELLLELLVVEGGESAVIDGGC